MRSGFDPYAVRELTHLTDGVVSVLVELHPVGVLAPMTRFKLWHRLFHNSECSREYGYSLLHSHPADSCPTWMVIRIYPLNNVEADGLGRTICWTCSRDAAAGSSVDRKAQGTSHDASDASHQGALFAAVLQIVYHKATRLC
jgi:hypothetical protein